MRLRRNDNAVSAACAIVAFLLMGCALAVFWLVAGFEVSVLKFVLIAYVCLAAPFLLLTPFAGLTGEVKHRSFRATPPAYMEGKRVKRRLFWLHTTCGMIAVIAAFGAWVCYAWAVVYSTWFWAPDPWLIVMFFGIPMLAFYAALFVSAVAAVWLGWATRREACELLRLGRRWPTSWLEPRDEEPKK